MPALRGQRADVAFIYDDPGAEAARLRGALLAAVLRLTPHSMAANAGCALVVLWAYVEAMPPGMVVWAALLVAMAGVALRSWWRGRQRLRETATPRVLHRATLHAGALAALWAVVPLAWFPSAAPAQQLQIGIVVAGMMGAGAFLLSPLPRACLVYLAIYAVAAVGALLAEGNPAHAGVGAMLAFYASTLAAGALAAGQRHVALLRARAAAADQGRMLALLLQDFEAHADEALWQADAQGLVSHASPRLAQLLGLPAGDSPVGRPLAELLAAGDAHQAQVVRESLADRRRLRDLPVAVHHGGRTRHLVLHGKRVIGEDGTPQGWRGVLADVTERVLSQKRLHLLAHTDPLTGLANRLTLRDALAECLKRGGGGALLSLDLDNFKGVNDSLGHTAGDQLLGAVAQRLRECMRPGDLVARLGGDEFAVLMQHTARAEDAQLLAERLIRAVAEPFELPGRHLRIGGSVGVAMFGATAGEADLGAEELFVRADMALYSAKEAGRGRHVVYSQALGERSRRRLAIEQGLKQAVQRNELSLHWQPKIDIASWRIVGAEALMRWETPALGRVGPAEFIGVAEQCGLIDELGRFALVRACTEATGPLAGLTVSVNVSPVQLQDPGFVEQVRQVLRETGLAAHRLELEITETLFIDDAHGALDRLHALRDLGVRIALDDFGTGYSSLAYLRRFPFDTLKIDRAFVQEALADEESRAIVHSIAALAATLGMRTVCEGVETGSQLAVVSAAGCDQVQGYVASAPRPLAQFGELVRRWPDERPTTVPLH
ncbi:MAG: EAL domain-containing protein [Rubrivivax sp.]|nr:EAL domain-containing protein [Rubrivivax sp.]